MEDLTRQDWLLRCSAVYASSHRFTICDFYFARILLLLPHILPYAELAMPHSYLQENLPFARWTHSAPEPQTSPQRKLWQT